MTWCWVVESRESTLQMYLTNSRAGLVRIRWEPGCLGNSWLDWWAPLPCGFPPLPRVWWIFCVILRTKSWWIKIITLCTYTQSLHEQFFTELFLNTMLSKWNRTSNHRVIRWNLVHKIIDKYICNEEDINTHTHTHIHTHCLLSCLLLFIFLLFLLLSHLQSSLQSLNTFIAY